MSAIITPIIDLNLSVNSFNRLFQSKTSVSAFETYCNSSLLPFKMRVLKGTNLDCIIKSAAIQLAQLLFPQRYARDFCCGCNFNS